MIQSLENFGSMAIQGTQVPMYTKHTLFLCIYIYIYILYQKLKITNKSMLNKAKHKTRLTQNKKQNTQVMQLTVQIV